MLLVTTLRQTMLHGPGDSMVIFCLVTFWQFGDFGNFLAFI